MTLLTVETEYFYFKKLTEGVYSAIAKTGKGSWSNAGVVDMGEELLVFDSFSTPSAARELRKQAEMILGKKVKYLINSHYHGDHVFGNQVFEDVTIISTSLTFKWFKEQNMIHDVEKEKNEMKQYLLNLRNQIETTEDIIIKASLIHQFEEMSKVLEELPHLKIVLPSVLFDKNLVIQGSQRNVELHCFGGGHTPSDAFMYLPDEKIAFMGDIVTEELHLPIYHPKDFLSILENVKQMEIETVVPGHGEVGTIELIDTLVDYLSFLMEKASEAHQNELSLNEFISEFITPTEYTNWKGVNGINRNLTTIYNFYVLKKI
ncbi:MBL fold metallo-hydrolase [Psychrobacillus vulpis]|uniref:MBL fold metallo-hydrolase n=1 Tax=Psychrobacillus vulpis TaxID=2325572 RepID=A0A544TTP2_9BACI|nr:MBL fold metallo-hydrolase [Psychrobacillus vulpis]TQR20842.1 MBL fold metallo-hydrolase [Psychrobacillus vulpis]